MLIDVGADNKEDAIALGVRPGQSIIPVCPFTPMANPKKLWQKLGITAMAVDWQLN